MKSSLSLLSSNSVGLAPGVEIPLIGPGGPIPTIVFSVSPETVIYEDSLATVAASGVPEPSSIVLFGIAIFGMLWVCCGRSQSSFDAFVQIAPEGIGLLGAKSASMPRMARLMMTKRRVVTLLSWP